MYIVPIFTALALSPTAAFAFDSENRVVHRPEVHCGANNIVVDINTEKPFRGRLYVQGEADNRHCLQAGDGDASSHTVFDLPIGACNMRRQRTMHPRGVSFSFTLVVSFHPFFVTGMDRAFHIRCFFLESVKNLAAEYGVGDYSSSKLKTELIEQDYQLPDCIYQLHDGPNGPTIQFAQVGQRVTHRWSCDDATQVLFQMFPMAYKEFNRNPICFRKVKRSSWIYGLLIHSCYADDGQNNKFELVDDRGCSTDSYLLPQIQYDPKALLAFTDTQVFKYADKVQLYFTCTVQLCYKHDGGCEGVTPPQCDNDPGHLQHVEISFPGDHASTMGPNFPSNIPFDQMSRKELRQPDFGHHSGHYSRESESGGNSREGSRELGNAGNTRESSHFDDIPRREKAFFGPIDTSMDFESQSYRDSPLNETDSDDISLLHDNSTERGGLSDKAKKKRRDLTMETDLSTDVIVLPFQKTKSGRPLLSTTHVCVSRTALVLLVMAALITIALCVVVAMIISRRPASYHKSMDAFH